MVSRQGPAPLTRHKGPLPSRHLACIGTDGSMLCCHMATCSLMALRDKANGALTSMRMPTTRNEAFRFTDISPLLKAKIQVCGFPAWLGPALCGFIIHACHCYT